jgi:hypothetical protein
MCVIIIYRITEFCASVNCWYTKRTFFEETAIFWVVTPCSMIGVYLGFGGTYRFHLQSQRVNHQHHSPTLFPLHVVCRKSSSHLSSYFLYPYWLSPVTSTTYADNHSGRMVDSNSFKCCTYQRCVRACVRASAYIRLYKFDIVLWMKIILFWDTTRYTLLHRYQSFGGIICLNLQGRTLHLESLFIVLDPWRWWRHVIPKYWYQFLRRHIPGDSDLHKDRSENLECHDSRHVG